MKTLVFFFSVAILAVTFSCTSESSYSLDDNIDITASEQTVTRASGCDICFGSGVICGAKYCRSCHRWSCESNWSGIHPSCVFCGALHSPGGVVGEDPGPGW